MASKHQKNLTARGQTAPRPGRNTKKIVILSVIAVLVAAAILSAALILILDWDEYHYIPADRKTVATCNGYKIPYEELRFVTMLCKSDMAYEYGEEIWQNPTAEHRVELTERVKETLAYNYALLSASKSMNKSISLWEQGRYVDDQIDRIKDELSEEVYAQYSAATETDNNELMASLKREFGDEVFQKYVALDNRLHTVQTKDQQETEIRRFKKEIRDIVYDNYLAKCCLTRHAYRTLLKLEYVEQWIANTPNLALDLKTSDFKHKKISEFADYVLTGGDYVCVVYVERATLESANRVANEMKAIEDQEERREVFLSEHVNQIYRDGFYYGRGELWEEGEEIVFALDEYEISTPVESEGSYFVYMRLPMNQEYVGKTAHYMLNNYNMVILNRDLCVVEFNDYGSSIDLVAMQ